MTDKNLTHDQEMEVESHAPYLKVFMWLAVLTTAEYLYARWSKESFGMLVLGLMTMAIIKAAMVGWYFMHLKFEGKWVYGWLVPAGILAVILTVALLPDVAMQPKPDETPDDEETVMGPPEQSSFPTVLISASK